MKSDSRTHIKGKPSLIFQLVTYFSTLVETNHSRKSTIYMNIYETIIHTSLRIVCTVFFFVINNVKVEGFEKGSPKIKFGVDLHRRVF